MAECASHAEITGSPGKSADGSTGQFRQMRRLNHNRAPRGRMLRAGNVHVRRTMAANDLPTGRGAMPQPALTVFLIIAAIAIVVVLIAVIVIALRAAPLQAGSDAGEADDEVQYAFIVNPSKPQAEARRLHIQRFCEAKAQSHPLLRHPA